MADREVFRRALAPLVAVVLVAGVRCSHRPPEARSIPRAAPVEGDLDGDGIPDRLDLCPNVAEDCDGFQDADGCPEPDNDGDGIPDECDLCPNEPETKNGVQDDDGCPEPRVLAPGRGDPVLTFAWQEAKLDVAAHRVLAEVAKALRPPRQSGAVDYAIERLAVLGHAASDEPRKERLAEERAEIARAALIALGVPAGMLEAHGVADRVQRVPENDPLHAENRRVSFVIVRSHGATLSVWRDGLMLSSRAAAAREADAGAGAMCPGGFPPRKPPPPPCKR